MNDVERAMRDAISDLEDKLSAAKADAERERAERRAVDQALADAIRERDDAKRRADRLRMAL